jgi:hypothetical protein
MPKPNLSPESVLVAARLFIDQHGKSPTASSGDAAEFFGHPETWAAVNLALTHGHRGLKGGSSLSKLIKSNRAQHTMSKTSTSTTTLHSIDGGLSQDPEEAALIAKLASMPDVYSREVTEIETELRDRFEYKWVPLEGPRNNLTVLNMITDPLAALKEAPTNSGEAVNDLKFHALQKPKGKMSPVELSEECGFTDKALHVDPVKQKAEWASLKKKAENISISFLNGENGHITYEVVDRGIGITPEDAPTTILEIAGDNKTNKETNFRYVGKNGVGGMSSLRFLGAGSGSVFMSYATHTYSFNGTKSKKVKVKNPMVWATVLKTQKLENGVPVLCRLVDKNGALPVVDPALVKEKVPGSILENMAKDVGTDVLKRVKKADEASKKRAGDMKEALHDRVAKVMTNGGPKWTTRDIQPGTRLRHYNYDLGQFNRAEVSKNNMRKIFHTYFLRALHPFTFFECRDLHFFNASWKAQRIRVTTGLRYYLDNSDTVVLGKDGTGLIQNIEFDNEWGQRESIDCNLWVLKRLNEALGGSKATRENYEAENRIRSYLNLGKEDSLSNEALKELHDRSEARLKKVLKTTSNNKTPVSEKISARLNDVKSIIKGRKHDGAPPVESQTVKGKTLLFSLSGITHDARPNTQFFQDCKMAALDTRTIVEVRLDRLSPLTNAHIIDAKREGLVCHTQTYKNMYAALVAAVKAHQPLKELYQEIRDLSDSQLGETDEDLIKSVNKIVELIEADKKLVRTREKLSPFPLGQSDTLRTIKVLPSKNDKVWLYPLRGKAKGSSRATVMVAGDAPDGFPLDSVSTEIEIEGGSARLTSHTPFHNGYATLTCEWEGPDRGEGGELRVRTKNPITGFTITSKPVSYEVAQEGSHGGKSRKRGGIGEKAPEITPRPITRNEWAAPTTGPFDEGSIASIVDEGENKYTVYVNVDNVIFAQQMDRRNYSSAHRETLRRGFTTWMAAFLYGLEFGALGYDKRRTQEGFSKTTRTGKDKHADYRHAMGMFMGLKFRRDAVTE